MIFLENATYKNSIKEVIKNFSIKNSSFLVTGASGLIGSCLIDALIYANEFLNFNNKIYALGRNKTKLQDNQ